MVHPSIVQVFHPAIYKDKKNDISKATGLN